MSEQYEVKMTLIVNAETKGEALRIIQKELGKYVEVELSTNAESDLFAELGVAYD